MRDRYDVAIIGGAAVGASVAWHLCANPDFNGSVVIIERDPTYARASTSLSAASIRTQFSNAINVKISQYGFEVIRDFAELMAVGETRPDLNFHPGGYLFLADAPDKVEVLRENHAVQRACGADVVLWDQAELAEAFPHLTVDDILLASYGRAGEGWFDNAGLMNGFRNKARALGADFVRDEVVALRRAGGRIVEATLKSGAAIAVGAVVNAAGPRAALVAGMAGLPIPVEPRKRTLFVFDCARSPQGSARVNGGRLPMMIDVSGVHCRPEGRCFLTGAVPPHDCAADIDDFDPAYQEFEEIIWPALAARSSAFEAIKVVNQWAGHYAFNTLDHNVVVGPHPDLPNFYFANGFSGHGLQQSPAIGRGVFELIAYGEFRALDLTPLGYDRIAAGRPFLEKAVI